MFSKCLPENSRFSQDKIAKLRNLLGLNLKIILSTMDVFFKNIVMTAGNDSSNKSLF